MYRDFLFYLKNLGYSKGNLKQIKAATLEFLEWMDKKRISQKTLMAYYEHLSQRPNKYKPGGLSSKTISGHLYALRLYFSYLEEKGQLTAHPMSGLSFPKPQSQQREILTPEEVIKLHEAAQTLRPPENHTSKAVLAVFYGCGLRRLEAERLNLSDIHLRSSILYVRHGKGGKRRAVPMSAAVVQTLKTYLYEARPHYGKTRQDQLTFFRHQYGGRMRSWSFERVLKNLLQIAGIEKNITLHSLRHSIATHLLHKGVPLESVRDFLGHQHLETTQIYTRIDEGMS